MVNHLIKKVKWELHANRTTVIYIYNRICNNDNQFLLPSLRKYVAAHFATVEQNTENLHQTHEEGQRNPCKIIHNFVHFARSQRARLKLGHERVRLKQALSMPACNREHSWCGRCSPSNAANIFNRRTYKFDTVTTDVPTRSWNRCVLCNNVCRMLFARYSNHHTHDSRGMVNGKWIMMSRNCTIIAVIIISLEQKIILRSILHSWICVQ